MEYLASFNSEFIREGKVHIHFCVGYILEDLIFYFVCLMLSCPYWALLENIIMLLCTVFTRASNVLSRYSSHRVFYIRKSFKISKLHSVGFNCNSLCYQQLYVVIKIRCLLPCTQIKYGEHYAHHAAGLVRAAFQCCCPFIAV